MLDRRKALSIAAVYSLILCGIVTFLVNHVQPTAYMDEVFHEEQTITYVHAEWYKWNPKITTPPGLYALTALIWHFLPFHPVVENFRFLNCFIAGVNLFVLAELTQSILAAVAISTLPVLFFTAILYYTDQLSLLALLLTFLAQRSSHNFLAFITGCFACFVRQTNVIWLAFMIGEQAVRRLSIKNPYSRKSALQWYIDLFHQPVDTFTAFFKAALVDAPHLTTTILLFAAVVIVFNNGDIVLGDRAAHQPVFHLPQLFYFFVFCAFHTPVSFIRHLHATLSVPRRRSLPWIMFALLSIIMLVHLFTLEHPYLLADNRHYLFYIWSRFFRRYKEFRYALAPLYLVCGHYVCNDLLAGSLSAVLTTWGYLLATALVLVPAGLIEPRYFVTPYVVWRLSKPLKREDEDACGVEVVVNALVNAVTVHIFVFHPFKWLSQPFTWQRFMW